ncbi:MAG: ABC transporter permease [Pirellulaceae bacterium]
MNLQPEDFWSFNEWLLRPDSFLESALLQGVVLIVLSIVLGLMVGYIISAARYGPVEGFYAVARTVRDLVRSDLPGTSPRRIMALAQLAFKEAIRRKVLFVIGLFVVGLLLAGWYLDPQSDDPARLYISFVLTSTNYLVLALALFISAFSLPSDIKSKTIYTIVTKPVRPTEIVLGRMLGFIGVGTLILIPMGLTSYIFVKRGLRHTHQKPEEAVNNGRGELVGETDYVQYHKHSFRVSAEDGLGLTDVQRGHKHVVRRTEDGEWVIGPPEGALRARVPSYGEVSFTNRSGEVKEAGIDVGNEQLQRGYRNKGIGRVMGISSGPSKIEHGYIEGATLATATFEFKNVTPARYSKGIPVDLTLRAYRSFKGDIESGIRGTLTVRNPETKAEFNPIDFVVDEYQVDEKVIPLSKQGTHSNGDSTDLDLFSDLVSSDGRVQIVVKCLDREQYLGVTKSSVYLRPAESTFAWNLAKAYGSIWLQMTMVIAFGVMFSTFLSGPVAMVATSVCVLLGFSAEQIYSTRHFIDSNIENGGGPIEAFVRILQQDAMTTQLDVEAFAGKVIKTLDAGIVYVLDAVATALPNLPKMVGTAEYAASGFDIFGALLGRHAVATLGYCVIAFLISYFFLKSREIAA